MDNQFFFQFLQDLFLGVLYFLYIKAHFFLQHELVNQVLKDTVELRLSELHLSKHPCIQFSEWLDDQRCLDNRGSTIEQ